ncbi:MOSC domain-containing protein [Pedobacter jejuensis]|uniref:MOSC domain-containing protein n=1 Tax=Pedobacter jejuensis TaxID=1268550 RepID=A0A3N0C0I9_9SPHI|nr:MOSC N-terminal beta barrel domain-containing protein [Pedobacter jejuensis]RNL55780.1 MOSC domain-containing protein [Pedobacter jejuensis]
MDKLHLSAIYIYPIKSLGGIKLEESIIEERGLRYDRRWVLIDGEGMFISQRKYPQLSLLQVNIMDDSLTVTHKENSQHKISFLIEQQTGGNIPVTIWDDLTNGVEVAENVSNWFSEYLNMPVKLVKMSDKAHRAVDKKYALKNEIVSFADGYPCLIIGQSALDNLNSKLQMPIKMDRFRPNFVITGGEAHVEDSFKDFTIGEVSFSAVKPCARCVLITVDQQTAIKSAEPLKTLSTYRSWNHKIMFGQNLLHQGSGIIRVGMELEIKTFKEKICL